MQGSDTVYSLNPTNGKINGEIDFASSIVQTFVTTNSTTALCFTRDGNATIVDIKGCYQIVNLFEANSKNIIAASHGNGYYAILPNNSRQIFLYINPENKWITKLVNYNEPITNIAINKFSNKVIFTSINSFYKLFSLDYPSGEESFCIALTDPLQYICFAGSNDELICICYSDKVQYFNSETGLLQNEYSFPEGCTSSVDFCIDKKKHVLYLFRFDSYFTINLNTGEINNLIKNDNMFNYETCSGVTVSNEHIFLANKTNGTIEEYNQSLNTIYSRIKANTKYISNIFINDTGTILFVSYKNGITELYDISKSSLIKEYDDLHFIPNKYIALGDKNTDYILTNDYSAYLCTNTNEIKAYIPNYSTIDSKNNIIIFSDNTMINTAPLFSLDMLREEAKQQLKGSTR